MPNSLTLDVPIVLNIVERNLETISSKLVFIPHDTPKKISALLSTNHKLWTTQNKAELESHFNMEIQSLETYHGGDDDGVLDDTDMEMRGGYDNNDLDPDLDLSDDNLLIDDMTLSFDEEDIKNITEDSLSASRKKIDIPDGKFIQTKTQLVEGVNTSNTLLFKSDTVTTFKQKVYLETGIPPYRQHIWFVFNGKSYQLSYRIKHDTYQPIDITDIMYIDTVVEGIPVDSMWYASKEIIQVESNDHITIRQLIDKYQISEFNIIDINSFINQKNYESVRQVIMSDSYAYELIYWGFVVKYFPMMSAAIFKEFMKNPSIINAQYPLMHPRRTKLREQFKAEQTLLLNAIPKYDLKIIKMNIINITANVKSRYINFDDNVVLRNLFDMFELNELIDIAICNTEMETQRVTLIKKYKNADMDYQHIPSNTIQFRVTIPRYGVVLLQINKRGNYKIIGEWVDGSELMFDTIFKVLDENIVPIISTINAYKSIVSTRPLEPITITNSYFSNINMYMYIKQKITTAKFTELRKYINQFVGAGVVESIETDNDVLHYYQLKGIFMHDINKYRFNAPLQNEYAVLYDSGARAKWDLFITKHKSIKIIRRFSDLKIEVSGLREEEYNTWFTFLQLMLHPVLVSTTSAKPPTTDTMDLKGNMKIRHMKEMDPVLFDLKKIYGTKIVYSQKCQNKHQPRIHDTPGASRTKYWNFTTNEPMWYSCPDPKYPHLYFKIGIHPKNYCMPCCKKKSIPTNPKETQANIHSRCLEDHEYKQEKKDLVRSRYVKTYSKFLHPGRISRLPEETLEPLMYDTFSNTSVSGIDEECANKESGYYIFGVAQHGQSVSNIGFLYCIMSALELTMADVIKTAVKHINESENWLFLLNGGIVQHFTTKKQLVDDITATFVHNKLSQFTDWNCLFIDIARMYLDLNVITFADRGANIEVTHDSDIYLYIKENVNYLHDYFIHKKSIIVVNRHEIYYPIYMLYTNIYFKSGVIDKRIYEHGDIAINTVSQIVQSYLNKNSAVQPTIDLHLIRYLAEHNKDIDIDTLYISDTNLCYGVCLNVKFKGAAQPVKMHIPVHHSMYTSRYKITFDIMGPKQSNDWNHLKALFDIINNSIAEYSADKGRMISDDDTQPLTHRVDPIYPFLEHEKWATYKGKLFGVVTRFLLFYVSESTINKKDVKYKINYIEEPHIVNQAIKDNAPPTSDRRSEILNTAIYNQYLYQLMFLTFIDILHTYRNEPIRKKIKKILNSNEKTAVKFSSTIIDKLKDVLHRYPSDLRNVVKMMTYPDPEHILDNSFLEFDKCIVTQLVDMSVVNCKTEVKKILAKYIMIGSPKFNIDVPNMISSCITSNTAQSPYCKNKKLIMSQKKFDEYIDILVMDIRNPLKNKYLTLYTFIPRSIDYFDFIIRPNEKIYITV
jgi:hypothetical protein